MTFEDVERRGERRIDLVRPCKVYAPHMQRYLAGTTWNISTGGMMLEIHRALPLRPGETLYVGIAMRRRDGLLCRDEMVRTTVLRSALTMNDHTAVALEFEQPMVAETETRRAA